MSFLFKIKGGEIMSNYILEMLNITKEFPGVKALDKVSFRVKKGEIHAIVGENGAGKSTLIKILSGVYPSGSYDGKIILNGKERRFSNIKNSEMLGISVIYQELTIVKSLSICENIFLGNEISRNGVIDWNKAYNETKKVLNKVGLKLNPGSIVSNLGMGQIQIVEIAKAISKNVNILILDEPSASLSETEVENLFQILRKLKSKGVTCIYISHRIYEVFEVADTVTVLRDGKIIGTNKIDEMDENKLIAMMVGRKLNQRFPRKKHISGEVVLELNNWTINSSENPDRAMLKDINFKARKGEILGISGLMGSGRTELAMSIIGAYGIYKKGEMFFNKKLLKIKNPFDAIKSGISYLTEDRKDKGLVLMMTTKNNISLASNNKISKNGIIDNNKDIKISEVYVNKLNIKCSSIEQEVCYLSGGNQQKVSLAKWLFTKPKVLILDEPTKGIDVGAKLEIYNIMNDLVEQGICVIMISSELPEILGMSDRILIMYEGKLNGELSWEEATQEKIMYYSTGGQ